MAIIIIDITLSLNNEIIIDVMLSLNNEISQIVFRLDVFCVYCDGQTVSVRVNAVTSSGSMAS